MKVNARILAASASLTASLIAACIAFTSPSESPPTVGPPPPVIVAYRDPGGVWTICDGITYIGGRRVVKGETATPADCKRYEAEAHAAAIATVTRLAPVDIPFESFPAFEDFVYNAGAGNFAASTMRAKLVAGDLRGACEQFPRWKYMPVAAGSPQDLRDQGTPGKALCTIRANNCYGLIIRRESQKRTCLKGVKNG